MYVKYGFSFSSLSDFASFLAIGIQGRLFCVSSLRPIGTKYGARFHSLVCHVLLHIWQLEVTVRYSVLLHFCASSHWYIFRSQFCHILLQICQMEIRVGYSVLLHIGLWCTFFILKSTGMKCRVFCASSHRYCEAHLYSQVCHILLQILQCRLWCASSPPNVVCMLGRFDGCQLLETSKLQCRGLSPTNLVCVRHSSLVLLQRDASPLQAVGSASVEGNASKQMSKPIERPGPGEPWTKEMRKQVKWEKMMREIEESDSTVSVLQTHREAKTLSKKAILGTLMRLRQLKKWSSIVEVGSGFRI